MGTTVFPGFVTSTFAYMIAAPFPPIEVNKTIAPQLCTYVRKSQNEPIFAPANQHWWKIYQDWSRHTPQLLLYDYWGLGFVMKPRAEVTKSAPMQMAHATSLGVTSLPLAIILVRSRRP